MYFFILYVVMCATDMHSLIKGNLLACFADSGRVMGLGLGAPLSKDRIGTGDPSIGYAYAEIVVNRTDNVTGLYYTGEK